jgi:hypothetical protein
MMPAKLAARDMVRKIAESWEKVSDLTGKLSIVDF